MGIIENYVTEILADSACLLDLLERQADKRALNDMLYSFEFEGDDA